MRTRLLISILLCGFCVNSSAQTFSVEAAYITTLPAADKQWIFYKPGNLLVTEDFEGRPNPSSEAIAITSSGFAFKAGYKNAGGKSALIITVYCTFDKDRSWMKEAGKNPYVLLHEQHHFDISYIAAMDFVAAIKSAHFNNDNYNTLLTSIYTTATKKLEVMQQAYDAETSNGRLQDKQAWWNTKIDQLKSAK